MPKRPLQDSETERAQSKQLTPDEDDKTMAEFFTTRITEEIFGHRPTHLEEASVQYIVDMRWNPQPRVETFLAHVQAACPRAKVDRRGETWNKLIDFFSTADATRHAGLEEAGDIQAFVKAFRDQRRLQAEEALASEPEPTRPVLSHSDTTTSAAAPSTVSRVSKSIAGSTSSSNISSSTLSAKTVLKMKDEYNNHFAAFKGEVWKLASGICVDEVVAEYVRGLSKESALHSFVIDNPATVLDLFTDPADNTELASILQSKSTSARLMCPNEEAFMRRFDEEPGKVVNILGQGWTVDSQSPDVLFMQTAHLAMHQIYVVYNNYQFTLPEEAPEAFYVHTLWGFMSSIFMQDRTLIYRVAEVHSNASFLRKNKSRRVEGAARQAVGRKVDGLVISRPTLLELCVMEAARKDAGPTDTKALGNTRKLAKVLKDTFDAICAKATKDISSELIVFGLHIASRSITFYTMRKLEGRLYQVCAERTLSFPLVWDEVSAMTILTIVASVMALRKRISEMNSKVERWVRVSFDEPEAPDRPSPPSTLSTPPGSPRLSPRNPSSAL